MPSELDVRRIDVRGLGMEVATAGEGPAVMLVHGIPHAWFLWRRVMTALSRRYFVVAPDLRGLGGTDRAAGGFDVGTVAGDLVGLLDALGIARATVVAIDLGVQAAFMLAMTAPDRVRGLALMEGLVGTLPGAERFLARGAPWWFGFHAVPSLRALPLVRRCGRVRIGADIVHARRVAVVGVERRRVCALEDELVALHDLVGDQFAVTVDT